MLSIFIPTRSDNVGKSSSGVDDFIILKYFSVYPVFKSSNTLSTIYYPAVFKSLEASTNVFILTSLIF